MSIYLNNKYTKCYYEIIDRAKNRTLQCYKESHHIIPKSIGGNDEVSNLICLTAREHYVVHWLLTKMTNNEYDKQKMIHAFWRMNNSKKYKINSVAYQNNKIENAKNVSKRFLGIPKTQEHCESLSKVRKGRIITESWRNNIGLSKTGEKHPLYGIKRPEIWNKKASETMKNKPKMVCLYCGKLSDAGNISRWHNDNCKKK